MNDKRLLPPSERADVDAKLQAAAQERAKLREASLRSDFTKTFQTPHGKRVMAWMKERSGFGKIILSADRTTGQIDPQMTTFAAMELNFYLAIRNILPTELIQEIEDDRLIQPSGTITEPSTGRTTERVSRKRTK